MCYIVAFVGSFVAKSYYFEVEAFILFVLHFAKERIKINNT